MTDQEIMAKLREKTTPELLSFRAKLRRIGTPESMALRFLIIKVLLTRTLFETYL